MAFSSQSFRAPKINKGNFSSPLSSSASKISGSISAPKLNTTKISFIKKENSPIVEAVNNNAESLTQTNEILIEIQKQLAFDFANRIAEEKETIQKIKAEESRRRFGEEEKAVEGTNKLKKGLFGAFNKVIAPARGIFDKLFEFFGIVLTGFVGNQAFEWLKNPENRAKITGVLNWVGENWKLLVGLFVGTKLLGPIGALISFGTLLSKLFRKGGPLGPNKLKNAAKNSSLDDCSRIKKALDNCSPKSKLAILKSLGIATAATTLPAPADAGTPQGAPVGDPVPANTPQGEKDSEKTSTPEPSPVLVPNGRGEGRRAFDPNRTTEPINVPATAAGIVGALAVGGLIAMLLAPEPITTTAGAAGLLSRFPKIAQILSKSKAPKVAPQAAKPSTDVLSKAEGALKQELTKSLSDLKNLSKSKFNLPAKRMGNDFSKTLSDQKKRLISSDPPKDIKIIKSKEFGGSTNFGLLPFTGLFTLPTVKSTPPPGTAPTASSVANQTVSIDAVNMNNPYMMITPEIYGMYAF